MHETTVYWIVWRDAASCASSSSFEGGGGAASTSLTAQLVSAQGMFLPPPPNIVANIEAAAGCDEKCSSVIWSEKRLRVVKSKVTNPSRASVA